ncbi:putative ribonuclease H-like domain-containing protein [Tanacetum coccineum]
MSDQDILKNSRHEIYPFVNRHRTSKCVRIKRLHDDLEVTAAKVKVTAVKYTARVKLVLLVKIEENILITTAERLQLLKEFMLTKKRSKTYQRKDKDYLEIKITYVITKEFKIYSNGINKCYQSKDYILLPLWTADPPFSQSLKSSPDAGFKPSSDDGKKVDENPGKDSEGIDQEKEGNVNSTNNVNDVSTNEVNVVGGKTSIELLDDPNISKLEDIVYSDDDEDVGAEADMNNLDAFMHVSPIPTTRIHKDHPVEQIIEDFNSAPQTRRMTKNLKEHGLKKVIHALKYPSWIKAMQEELLQFKLQEVWMLVDLPNEKRDISIKWAFRNKKDERGIVIKNKARLVAQGYTQEEGIDYDEVFAPVARIEAIRQILAYASFKDLVVYQMDVKSAFIYGKIEEEVYVCQPSGFEDPDFPDRVYKVENALYGLHQAPRAWDKGDILLVQVYVDDIIFGSTKKSLCTEFEKMMHKKFQMSYMGKLTFFLGLFIDVKTASTPMETQKPLLKDEDGKEVDVHLYRSMIGSLMYFTSSRPDIMFAVYSPFDLVAYTDSAYARASLDRKSTTEGCQILRSRLISWQCKKKTVVANSTTEVEYVAASSCCGQVLWIQNQLLDYEYNFMHTKIFIDNNIYWRGQNYQWEVQLHALVDGKKIIISEASMRRVLKLEDEEGIDCLPNSTIFEQLALMGYEKISQKLTFYKSWKFLIHTILQCLSPKTTAWNEFSSTMASAITCLATNQKFNFLKFIFEGMIRNLDNVSRKFLMYPRWCSQVPRNHGDTIAQTRLENVSKLSNDSLLAKGNTLRSDEDRHKLDELMALCTTLQSIVLDLEKTKTTQANEIASLKRRVKKLEKKRSSRTHKLKRLYKVGLTARVESSSDEEDLGEDASKQGRRINAIDADEDITLVIIQDDVDNEMFDVDAINVNTAATTVIITTEEITLAQALEALKTSKPKVKGIVFQEPGKSTTTTIISSQQSQDKSKGIMIEEPVKPKKKKDQISFDEEVALKLQDEFDEEERTLLLKV